MCAKPVPVVMHVLAVRVGYAVKVVSWKLIVYATSGDEELPLDAWNVLNCVLEYCNICITIIVSIQCNS